MDAPPFERLGIVGFGLIGGSVALAAKRRWPSLRVAVCDPNPIASEAVRQGLVEAIVSTPGDLVTSDLIVVATPVQLVPGVLSQLSQANIKAVVTDTASTKRSVMSAAQSASNLLFVGGHPLAETDGTGLAAARADLFDGRAWLLVSATCGSASEARDVRERDAREAMLTSFVVGLGARPEWTDAVTHDRVIAHVSQAPHVVSMAVKSESNWSEDWRGILDTNADFIADALVALAAKLPTSSNTLTETPVVRDVFSRARELKANQ